MEIFGRDIIIGDFKASDFNLIIGSTEYSGQSEDEMGNDITIAEQFIGRNPVPAYFDYSYSEKLRPSISLIKNNCYNSNDTGLTEFEIRNILRLITGFHEYKWMKVITDDISEDTWYKVKIVSTALIRYPGIVAGIKINMECDSQFGYSPINVIKQKVTAYKPFYIFNNSDDIYNYLYPKIDIKLEEDGNIELVNNTENWTSIINNVVTDEIVTINSEKQILTSTNEHENVLLDDFNLHWFRLVNGLNEYSCNLNCEITVTFRLRRKGGFICR